MGIDAVAPLQISKEELDPHQYVFSLLKAGMAKGLISQQAVRGIQVQLLDVLKELIAGYTQGKSSSIGIDKAESIMTSVIYVIDAYVAGVGSPEEGLSCLNQETMSELHRRGLKRVRHWLEESRRLYEQIMAHKLNVSLDTYHDTLASLPGYFHTYDLIYAAHDVTADMDYPLVFDDMKRRGIFYIKRYLETLAIETEFCSRFSREEVEKTLMDYGRKYRIDYVKTPLNLFEILINNALASGILGKRAEVLRITALQYEIVKELACRLEPAGLSGLIEQAKENMVENLEISGQELLEYIDDYQEVFRQRLSGAVEHGNLDYLIIPDQDQHSSEMGYLIKSEEEMSGEHFHALIKRIRQASGGEAKADIIHSGIASFRDFRDVLSGDWLYAHEFAAVFKPLGDMELALLGQIVWEEDLRNGPVILSARLFQDTEKAVERELPDTEAEWKLSYVEFLKSLDQDRLQAIERLIRP